VVAPLPLASAGAAAELILVSDHIIFMAEESEYWIRGPDALKRFTEGMAAAQRRLERGYDTQSALECIVLSAAIVDGLLRIGLIMRDQLDRHTNEVDERFLHQKDSDKKIAERWIIDQAEKRRVVSKEFAARLHLLYEARNKCIHRYIISDVNYHYATKLVFDYADAIEVARVSIKSLEEEQYEMGIGMVAARADTNEPGHESGMKEWLAEMVLAKELPRKRDR
jgi:uncharacterized protein YutE (UPF0331/DUF86 family)